MIAPLGCFLGVGAACLPLLAEGQKAYAADGRVFTLGAATFAWDCGSDPEGEQRHFATFKSDIELTLHEDDQLLTTGSVRPVHVSRSAHEMSVDLDGDGVAERVSEDGMTLFISNGRTGHTVRVRSIIGGIHLVGAADVRDDGLVKVIFQETSLYRAVGMDARPFDLGYGCLRI